MYSPSLKTTVEAFTDIPFGQIIEFGRASVAVRCAIAASQGVVMIPERGGSPLAWAAEGLPGLKTSPYLSSQKVSLPLGTYAVLNGEGMPIHHSGSTKTAKSHIVAEYLTGQPVDAGITIVDEVQMGGTITDCITRLRAFGLVDEREIHTAHMLLQSVTGVIS